MDERVISVSEIIYNMVYLEEDHAFSPVDTFDRP